MAILKVLVAPDPVLSKPAEPVGEVTDEIRKLMDDMLETMYDEHGVGLGANQVGVLKRVLVIDLQDDDDQNKGKDFYPIYLADPVVTSTGGDYVEAVEACLSVPGLKVPVKRPDEISIEYLDYNNKKQSLSAKGWLARVIQHEIDHIDGKTLLEYLSPLKRGVAVRKLKKYKKDAV